MPKAATAKLTRDTDVPGFTVVALRLNPAKPDDAEFLITKTGQKTEWVDGKSLDSS